MKRLIPLLITALGGFVLIVSFFIPSLQRAGEEAAIWFDILAAIAFILGGANLFRLQLQRISDREPGWGYAGITLICFVATLLTGLLKIGAPPEAGVEAYGKSTVRLPVSSLPTFRIPLTVPATRGDGEPLPRSVRQQLILTTGAEGESLTFTGWMDEEQKKDLIEYQDTIAWRCQIEQLAARAVPPPSLVGKVSYNAGHGTLAFAGMMTDDDRTTLQQTLRSSAEVTRAIDQLEAASRRVTSKTMSHIPSGFVIPDEMKPVIQRSGNTLSVQGPISTALRDQLAMVWVHAPRARPTLLHQRAELLAEIERAGSSLNPLQRTAFDHYFAADWTADALIQALNTAGISEPTPKTACQLLEEMQTSDKEPELTLPPPPPVVLNDAQVGMVRTFIAHPEMSWNELRQQLVAAGDLIPPQLAALQAFELQLPTLADHRKGLCFRLLEAGPLSMAQKTLLLQGARSQFAWRKQVGELFLAAHQVKFPWSGNYSSPDTPFWWLYEYVFQPLLTTTFALLAFYVASAAFRAFRAKNIEAILLLGTAFIILLGRTSAGPALTSWIPDRFAAFRMDQMTAYIMSIFNTAGNRAIMIGIALGTVSTSLKVLLGIDRSYLGQGDD